MPRLVLHGHGDGPPPELEIAIGPRISVVVLPVLAAVGVAVDLSFQDLMTCTSIIAGAMGSAGTTSPRRSTPSSSPTLGRPDEAAGDPALSPPDADLIGTEQIAEEVVRSLGSGIGLVLAVPLTTAVAALIVAGSDDIWEDA